MKIRDVLAAIHARRLRAQLAGGPVPRHIAIIMDGNRRWARQMGFDNVSLGHRYGAEHVQEVLGWCADAGVGHVTVYLASIDNLNNRSTSEVEYLMEVAEKIIPELLTRPGGRWRVHLAGRLDLLPEATARALRRAEEVTGDRDAGFHLTLAAGYGGRAEVIDALRSLLGERARAGATLAQLAETVTAEDIAAHLYNSGHPDPDLVIRTSGERRLSDFLLWQTAHARLYFCDVNWPAFRHLDFLRALRAYAAHP